MKVTISYKHLESTPGIESVTHKKSEKLKKYFEGQIELRWNFAVEKAGHVAHCHLTGSQMDYFAEATTDSIYSSIDDALDRLERQIRKKKELWRNKKHIAAA